MSDKAKPIPEDHPIQEIWENNKKSTIELAREGDKFSIKSVLGSFIMKNHHNKQPSPEVMQFLSDCFLKILSGDSPDEAFGFKKGTKGRPELEPSEKFEQATIGSYVAGLMNKGTTLEVAVEKVSKEHFVSESTAKKAYLKYMKV